MTEPKIDLFKKREARPGDTSFILATWLRGLRYGNDWFELIEAAPYFDRYQTIIEALINHPDTKISVACLKDDEDVIIAYSVYSDKYLHWVFTKAAWRNIGVAKSLVPDTIKKVSHLTKIGRSILAKYPEIKFNPFFT